MTDTAALFDELTGERSERARWILQELRTRSDLAAVVRHVLVEEWTPGPDRPVLEQHRRVVRVQGAVGLLDALAPADAFAVIAQVTRPDRDAVHYLAPAVQKLLQRAPEHWPHFLDPDVTGIATLRRQLGSFDRALLEPLMKLARRGIAGDLVYPLLARAGEAEPVIAAAEDTALDGDTRALALRAANSPAVARRLVAAGTHATSRSLVTAVLGLLQVDGLDSAFALGEGERVFESFRELGAAITRWVESNERVDVGLVPMYQGVDITHAGAMTLTRSRDQKFVVGGEPVWAVRHYHWDDRDDPNNAQRLRLYDGPSIDDSRLRAGAYERLKLTVIPQRREAGSLHPFAHAWVSDDEDDERDEEAIPNTLDAHWWHAEAPGFEVAFLPLRADGAGIASEIGTVAYAWSMAPSSIAEPLYIYAVVLRGESLLDAGGAIDVELVFPIARPLDREVVARIGAPR